MEKQLTTKEIEELIKSSGLLAEEQKKLSESFKRTLKLFGESSSHVQAFGFALKRFTEQGADLKKTATQAQKDMERAKNVVAATAFKGIAERAEEGPLIEQRKAQHERVYAARNESESSLWASLFNGMQDWADKNSGKASAEQYFGTLMKGVEELGSMAFDSIFNNAEFKADTFFRKLASSLAKIALNQAIAGLFTYFTKSHHGGVAGVAMTGSREISPAAFAFAPRFHGGGLAGLRQNEVPAILTRGEGIFTPAQMKALGMGMISGPQVLVNINNSMADAAAVEVSQAPTANGGLQIDVMIDRRIDSYFSNGKADKFMRGIYNVNRAVPAR